MVSMTIETTYHVYYLSTCTHTSSQTGEVMEVIGGTVVDRGGRVFHLSFPDTMAPWTQWEHLDLSLHTQDDKLNAFLLHYLAA